ncbi:carotenoid oxygenase family protein [Mycolicibacterium sp.]|uniref:carotenoid oxygenase family protein n=1 Tax=Mycolicibacterium sp. TaxID=2320850 RepID=UPI00355EB35F
MPETDSASVASAEGHTWPPRFFDSVDGEHDLPITEITGTLPPDLTGTLYRNGSGRWQIGSSQVNSIFDVDGMISAFILDGRGVHFRNRFVRTDHYRTTTAAGAMVQRGVTQQRPGGPLANIGRLPANTANTSVMLEPDSLLALHEGGRPHRMDLDTLDTLGMCSLGGALQGPAGAFSAHYTHDPVHNTSVNFGFDPYYPRIDPRRIRGARTPQERRRRLKELAGEAIPRIKLRMYETDNRTGRTRYLRSVPLPGQTSFPIVHDMALTARYGIFCVAPYRIRPAKFLLGARSMWDSLKLFDGEPTYLVLAPRNGDKLRIVETDPFFSWHYTNAFDDGDDVVVELSRWSLETLPGLHRFGIDTRLGIDTLYDGLSPAQQRDAGRVTRLRISASGRVTEEVAADLPADFPQFDQRRSTQRHDISYVTVQRSGESSGTGIARIDHRSGTTQQYRPPHNILLEPTFVPRSRTSAEDDGWVLTLGYDAAEHRSRLMIFDAAHLDAGPIAEAWLPFHLPMSYHGAFTSRVAAH